MPSRATQQLGDPDHDPAAPEPHCDATIHANVFFWDASGGLVAAAVGAGCRRRTSWYARLRRPGRERHQRVDLGRQRRPLRRELTGKTVALEVATGFSFGSPMVVRALWRPERKPARGPARGRGRSLPSGPFRQAFLSNLQRARVDAAARALGPRPVGEDVARVPRRGARSGLPVRRMPLRWCPFPRRRSTDCAGAVKLGQPVPESNFSSERNTARSAAGATATCRRRGCPPVLARERAPVPLLAEHAMVLLPA